MRRRASRVLLIAAAAACGAIWAAPCAAQVDVTLDAGASIVKYEGFLSSGAFALTPSAAWRSPLTTLAARGTALVFESGNASLLGLLSASAFSRPLGALRVEGAAEAGASTYASYARYGHVLGRPRLHYLWSGGGVWAGPVAGSVWRGDGARGAWGASAGWWARWSAVAVGASATHLAIGDTAYSDLEARLRWRRGALEVEGVGGARVASRGGGRGVYGDMSASVRLTEAISLMAAGGSYPSDPVRGSISGTFLTAGVRLAPRPARRPVAVRQLGRARASGDGEPGAGPDRALVVVERIEGLVVLVVRAAGARSVDVMGDFTDWQPLPLAAVESGRFEYAARLSPGLHRFNLRLDGGPWGVPQGASTAPDEFGGSVGVLVVP